MQSRYLIWLLLLPVLFGFRAVPLANNWAVSKSDPTLWIKMCSIPVFSRTDFPEGDPLAGTNPDFNAVLQSVIDDYNAVGSSFVRLAVYPADPNNPGAPAPGDSAFTTALGAVRTIDICFSHQTFTGGFTVQKHEGNRVIGCSIKISDASSSNARAVARTLTHELGHCFGLAHPQETTHSVMSYFSDAIRLQIDDKMGLTYLYPTSGSAKENATLGLACAPE